MGGINLVRLKKDSEIFFEKYEKMLKMKGAVTEAEAIQILCCSTSTLQRWCKKLRIIKFMGVNAPSYRRKDIESIRLHRQYRTLIKKLRNL